MNIHEEIKIVDLALLYKDVLIISDLQIGLEGMLQRQGVFVPLHQFEDIIERLEKLFKHVSVKTIVINGDLKHEFGRISDEEWRYTLRILDFLSRKGEVILVQGNHDLSLGPIARKRNIKMVEYFRVDDIGILHGHKITPAVNDANVLIIGHEHPAVTLNDTIRHEKYKCFLKGSWNDKTLIVMPSFTFLSVGSDVRRGRFLSPYLQDGVETFKVYIVEDKIYEFGELGKLSA